MDLWKTINFKNSFTGSLIFVVLIFSCLRFAPFYNCNSSTGFRIATAGEEYVPESIVSIQEAINEAENGSTVIIPSGIYFEHVIVNKTISLVGENISTTIIDGSNAGTVVRIIADGVNITGFTIQNSGWGWYRNGIYVYRADNCKINNNILLHNCHNIRLNCSQRSHVINNTINGDGYGIRLISSLNCTATGNSVSNCIGGVHLQNATNCTVEQNYFTQNSQGIRLYSPCSYNKIVANTVYNNTYDGMIEVMPPNGTLLNNIIFHNNFINNTNPFIYKVSSTIWDDGYPSGGNYWSRYNGTDLYNGPFQNETGSDGIGDEPYAVNSFDQDRYPLMHPWRLLPVHNLNTGVAYKTIQEAIDTNETLSGHKLWIDSGVYYEHVNVHKSLTLIGENQTTTIIDGDNVGTVLSISADNVNIINFTLRNSGLLFPPYGDDCCILLDHSSGGNISHCIITNNRIGIYFYFAENHTVEHNVVSSNHNGIWLWFSGNNSLIANRMLNNSYNFGVFGGSFSDFNNVIDINNTVDDKPINYLIGIEDEIIDNQTDIGVLYLINCNNVTVRNLEFRKNGHGVFGYNVTESRIENVTALENNYGIQLQDSSGNFISNNHCSENWVGILLYDSDYNTVEMNIARNCEKGISLYNADRNNLEGNTIQSNLFGIRSYSSNSNEIFHNNLIENINQVDLIHPSFNIWDNSFEGNFWSNYNGSDIDPRDGLGDIPVIIDDSNHDQYPLSGSFHNFTVSYDENLHEVSVISNSTILNFIFEPINNTIILTINGTDETFGFCRIRIPHSLIEPEITVIIDDGLTQVLYPNYTLHDDGSYRWIYFAYQHSTHKIIIVPEFWPLVLLSTLMITTLCFLLYKIRRMKLKR